MKTDENNRVWATHLKPSLICTPPSHHSCNNTRMSSLPSALQHPPRNHRHLLYSERDVGAGVRRSETELVPCVPSCKVGPQASVRICLHSMSIPHSRGCDIKEQIKNILTGWKPAERKKKKCLLFKQDTPHFLALILTNDLPGPVFKDVCVLPSSKYQSTAQTSRFQTSELKISLANLLFSISTWLYNIKNSQNQIVKM